MQPLALFTEREGAPVRVDEDASTEPDFNGSLADEIPDVVASVRAGEIAERLATGHQALAVQAVADALYPPASEGREVAVEVPRPDDRDADPAPGFRRLLLSLDGRVAAVTGCGSGLAAIGAGLAQTRAASPCSTSTSSGRSPVAAEICDGGTAAFAMACDVTDSTSVREVLETILGGVGQVDVLVNSAGTAFRSPAEEFPEEELDRVLALNLKGTYPDLPGVRPADALLGARAAWSTSPRSVT